MVSWANAQEVVIDIPVDGAIEEMPAPDLEQPVDVPLEQGGIVVDEELLRDEKRLDIMAFQALSFESTGEYTQVKDAQVVEGDVIGFEASMIGVVEPAEEIHVYDAPCGKGWQLLITEQVDVQVRSSTTGQVFRTTQPIVRSYGYGCEHVGRTFDW